MPLISLSCCILSCKASSSPTMLGHGLAGRASLQAVTTSVREGSGGSRNQLPAQASYATPLLYTQRRQRGLCLQRCPLGIRTSAALYCCSHPERGFGAQSDTSPLQHLQPPGTTSNRRTGGNPNCTACQDSFPIFQPPKSNFRTASEASNPRKFPAAPHAVSSLLVAATFPVTQRETQQL